jgi:hypothetical protein
VKDFYRNGRIDAAQIAPGCCSTLEAGEAVTMRTHLLHIKAIRAARNRIVSRSNLRNTTGHLGRPLFRSLRPPRREAAALSGMCDGRHDPPWLR